MTKKEERKLITYICLSIIAVIVLFGLLGCKTTQISAEKQTLLSYEAMGAILETTKPILISLCENEVLNSEDCQVARLIYNEAVQAYYELAEIAEKVIDTGIDNYYKEQTLSLMNMLNLLQMYTEVNKL
jgi:hypothetical protein